MENKTGRALTKLTLSGFKSIFTKQTVSVGPLTLLSGANSSGKSSVTQALLLLKQTVEAPYDPGALMLNGPNVRMTSASQVLAKSSQIMRASFSVGMAFNDNFSYETFFRRDPDASGGFELAKVKLTFKNKTFDLSPESNSEDIKAVNDQVKDTWSPFQVFKGSNEAFTAKLVRSRCSFAVCMYRKNNNTADSKESLFFKAPLPNTHRIDVLLQKLIHVPGLRGNPERMYATTAVGDNFPGRFETYVASIIRHWQDTKSPKFEELNLQLQTLGLTASLTTQRRNDTEVEIRVSRHKLRDNGKKLYSLVSIADVGFGVSQVLPVLVALLVAEKEQIVIIEQPELHLHPRAQTKLAAVISASVNRGVRVIIETHSSLLLIGIQTAVAKGELASDQVALNWFSTTDNGHTKVSTGEIDKVGAIGNWPTDFMDVRLDAESAYLEAVENQMMMAHGNF